MKIKPILDELKESTTDVDEKNGIDVIFKSLSAPFNQILENAGYQPLDISNQITSGGFNAKTGEFVDMFDEGIIDPKKVTREAIQNASSVVGMILTTECMVVNKKEDKPLTPPMSPIM